MSGCWPLSVTTIGESSFKRLFKEIAKIIHKQLRVEHFLIFS